MTFVKICDSERLNSQNNYVTSERRWSCACEEAQERPVMSADSIQ